MSLAGGAEARIENGPIDEVKPKAGTKRHKYWLKEWQWYAVFTAIGIIAMVTGLIASIAYLALAGIAVVLFAGFGVAYGLIKERSS